MAGTLVALGVWSFALFGIDQRRASRGQPRVPERTLLISALVSGSPGARPAMATFRHEARRRPFRVRMVVVTGIDIGVLIVLPAWL